MKRHFTVDARAILNLGRESIRDHITAVIELVKNAYDADATRVDVVLVVASEDPKNNFVRIRDNGSGMSEAALSENWLRIGYSAKRTQKISEIFRRRTTGEKGIGRISADRICSILELSTAAPRHSPTGLVVHWDAFDADHRAIEEVALDILQSAQFEHDSHTLRGIPQWVDKKQGTELTSRGLRHAWQAADVLRLRSELSAFASPYDEVPDFEVFLYTDLGRELCGKVDNDLPESAAVDLFAEFDGIESIRYRLTQPSTGSSPIEDHITWSQLIQRTGSESKSGPSKAGLLGQVKVRLSFYPRKAEVSALSQLSLEALREFLDANAGVRIYRDQIRVRPYGDDSSHGGDWLRLAERKTREPAGPSRATFRISPNQLVGAVFVGRDSNPQIVDSAGREGLVQNEAYQSLRYLTLGCVTLLESAYHESHSRREPSPPKHEPAAQLAALNQSLLTLADDLSKVTDTLPRNASRVAKQSAERIKETLDSLDAAARAVEAVASQATIYRGLATTGIAATVFGHETQSAISQVEGSVNAAILLLNQEPDDLADSLEELEKARVFAARVASWGVFALTRVQRDKRRKKMTDLRKLADSLIAELKPVFGAADVDLRPSLSPVAGRIFAMDVESVLLNLLTNAYTACQQESRKRIVQATVGPCQLGGKEGVSLVVADTGPGVAKGFTERVWEPLFTTKVGTDGKPIGTGLGLSIVASIVDEMRGTKRIGRDPTLKGARFEIQLPFA